MQRFGETQLKILELLWQKGKMSAKEITDQLSEIEPTTRSTIQTLLRRMEQKGAVKHEIVNRTFIFSPTVTPDNVKKGAITDMVGSVFHGSAKGMIAYLLKNQIVSKSDLIELQQMNEEEKNSED